MARFSAVFRKIFRKKLVCNFGHNELRIGLEQVLLCYPRKQYSIEYRAEQPVQQIERLEQTNKLSKSKAYQWFEGAKTLLSKIINITVKITVRQKNTYNNTTTLVH